MKMDRWNGTNGLEETWLHHKYRELCSGSMNDRRWYHELALWLIYAGRRNNYRAGERQLKRQPNFPYIDRWLCYAATARCQCGAGLAYHYGTGVRGEWACSDILTGRISHADIQKHQAFPFVFYEINSENQPSAYGRTTRPGNVKIVHGGFGSIIKPRS